MSKELFVFDHDGTWTDPVATHYAYTDIFEEKFANRTGDGGEFDLVTPYALQINTMLITSIFTPPWEANFFRTQNSLEGIANKIITDLDK